MKSCPHRTITEAKTLRCALLPGEILPGPLAIVYPCHACEALWTNSPPDSSDLPLKALDIGQYHPDAPFVDDAGGRLQVCGSCAFWRRNKCSVPCACRTGEKPDPSQEKGPNCPKGKWRRTITNEE